MSLSTRYATVALRPSAGPPTGRNLERAILGNSSYTTMPKPTATTNHSGRPQSVSSGGPRRWLMLVHQLPPLPSNLRVRTWRRLQELGAVAVKQSVYMLPDTAESREDFEWLKVEIEGAGGDAVVFSAEHLDGAA